MNATQTAIVIRDVQTRAEMIEVEQLQQEVWGVADREILPALAMIPMKQVGGILLGAFDGPKLIGFSFAFPGFEDRRPILHSDMLAVKPDYRSLGVGRQLKLAQREQALEQGIDTITWTFDPLQALNANLNFAKLGVIADRYFINYYGETTSFLHSTGTDRLWVSWRLETEWVKDRIEKPPALNEAFNESFPAMVTVGNKQEPISSSKLDSPAVFVDVPNDFKALVRENRELGARRHDRRLRVQLMRDLSYRIFLWRPMNRKSSVATYSRSWDCRGPRLPDHKKEGTVLRYPTSRCRRGGLWSQFSSE